MHRQKLKQLLSLYQTVFEEDKRILEKFQFFINENCECFSRNLKVGHVTGSAWIIDESRSYGLFTYHKKLNKWRQKYLKLQRR